jgi:RHS repeat-associated protein
LIARYDYNGLNQRVRKTVGSTVTTSFFNQQWQELEAVTGGQTTANIWGLRYIDDLVLRERGSERLYSIADPNWNVVALTNASGTVQERMRYDAFGRITWLNAAFAVKANSDFAWNRAFTGQVLDSETGMMLYRNRFYHTGLGRFVQRDPIGYGAGDENLYRYVSNMPLIHTDIRGLSLTDTEKKEKCDEFIRSNRRDLEDRETGRIVLGFVLCDNKGNKMICIDEGRINRRTRNQRVRDVIKQCLEEHEEQHYEEHAGECPKSDDCPPFRMPPKDGITRSQAECDGHTTEYNCLSRERNRACSSLPNGSFAQQSCFEEIDHRMAEVRQDRDRWCAMRERELRARAR